MAESECFREIKTVLHKGKEQICKNRILHKNWSLDIFAHCDDLIVFHFTPMKDKRSPFSVNPSVPTRVQKLKNLPNWHFPASLCKRQRKVLFNPLAPDAHYQSWALSVFFNFFTNKKDFIAFFIKLITYFCSSPI